MIKIDWKHAEKLTLNRPYIFGNVNKCIDNLLVEMIKNEGRTLRTSNLNLSTEYTVESIENSFAVNL